MCWHLSELQVGTPRQALQPREVVLDGLPMYSLQVFVLDLTFIYCPVPPCTVEGLECHSLGTV